MRSIIQSERCCLVCRTEQNLHLHHVYSAGNRKLSDQNGFTCYLCARHHNMSNAGVHFNRELDLNIKQTCQRKYEETHTRAEFMQLIGKNYL